jgi:hypothetical protein
MLEETCIPQKQPPEKMANCGPEPLDVESNMGIGTSFVASDPCPNTLWAKAGRCRDTMAPPPTTGSPATGTAKRHRLDGRFGVLSAMVGVSSGSGCCLGKERQSQTVPAIQQAGRWGSVIRSSPAAFSSTTKFASHIGWRSFWEPISDKPVTVKNTSFGMTRDEVGYYRCSFLLKPQVGPS